MTCIVGYTNKKEVYIGGDSAGVSEYDILIRADEKVFINDEFIMGFTSSFRMGQILRYSFDPPPRHEGLSDDVYLYKYWIQKVIKTMKSEEYATVKDGEVRGGSFLFGYRGNLYSVESDFQIGKQCKPYAACGCGRSFALGALYVLEKEKINIKDKIKIALLAAEYGNAGVSGPFHIMKL